MLNQAMVFIHNKSVDLCRQSSDLDYLDDFFIFICIIVFFSFLFFYDKIEIQNERKKSKREMSSCFITDYEDVFLVVGNGRCCRKGRLEREGGRRWRGKEGEVGEEGIERKEEEGEGERKGVEKGKKGGRRRR